MSVYGVIADIDMSLVQWTALLTTEQPRLYTQVTSAGSGDAVLRICRIFAVSTSHTKLGADEEFATGVAPVQVPSRRPESLLRSIVLFVSHGHLVAQCIVNMS
jgi:hypothetical protein